MGFKCSCFIILVLVDYHYICMAFLLSGLEPLGDITLMCFVCGQCIEKILRMKSLRRLFLCKKHNGRVNPLIPGAKGLLLKDIRVHCYNIATS